MSHSTAKPDHGEAIGRTEKGDLIFATTRMQLYMDELEEKLNANLIGGFLVLEAYDFADLPATAGEGNVVYVNDLTGQRAPVYFDNTNWRRFSDNTIAS